MTQLRLAIVGLGKIARDQHLPTVAALPAIALAAIADPNASLDGVASFASLEEAERALSRVRSWQIAERGQLVTDAVYEAYLRMRLDVSQLPKPFQLSILSNRGWTLASEWKRWRYSPAREGSR